MKQHWRLLLVVTLALVTPALAAVRSAGTAPLLAVALQTHAPHVDLGGTHGYKLTDPAGRQIEVGWGGTRITVTGAIPGLRYKGQTYQQLRLLPVSSGFVLVNGKPYRGTLELRASKGGIDVINRVGVEPYLWGVVKAEMTATAPQAALRAQAVAARTFAMRNQEDYSGRGYSLRAGEQSQVYGGVKMEDPRCTQAVNDTRGVVLTFDGRLIEAQYHAACGGHTENNEDVWEKAEPVPYERARPCWGCQNYPLPAWSVDLDYATIQRKLGAFDWDVGTISRIDLHKSSTGRVKAIMVQSSTGTARIPGNNFRLIMDRRAIKSLMVDGVGGGQIASAAPDEEDGPGIGADDQAIRGIIAGYMVNDPPGHVLRLSGRGSGHGVGMCQWGARRLAMAGKSYQEILRTYYSGVELRRAY